MSSKIHPFGSRFMCDNVSTRGFFRGGDDDVEVYHGVGTILRHGKEDAEGMSEVAVQFFSPMDLRLQDDTVDASIVL